MIKLFSLLCFLIMYVSGFSQGTAYNNKFSRIDLYLDSIMKDWNIPGLGINIVYKDQLIYSKGYGYRELERKLPFDTKTIFPIASNSKLFTATLAAMLAEEGTVELDAPAKKYYPSLHFSADELNTKTTLRDLLSHRTGLTSYDGLWVNTSYSRNELVEKIQYMKPGQAFRDKYIYNNMMYTTAGAVLEKASGNSWEELIRKRFLEPLQMKTTCFTQQKMIATNNYSSSYFEVDSTRTLIKRSYLAMCDALGPAGSMKSNLTDLGNWMIAQLNNGTFQGRQVIPASAIAQTLVPNAIADRVGRWNELSNALYCLGRTIQTYKGYKITSHTGSIDGFYSNMTFLPEKELAVYIIFNQDEAGSLRQIISLPVFDILLNLSYTPWIERYKKSKADVAREIKKAKDSLAKTQIKNTKTSKDLNEFVGTYYHSAYGDINITAENNSLYLSIRNQKSQLHHFHYDQFTTKEEKTDLPDFRLNFFLNERGEINRFETSPYGDPVVEFVRRKPK